MHMPARAELASISTMAWAGLLKWKTCRVLFSQQQFFWLCSLGARGMIGNGCLLRLPP